jgi:hypothetical protein
MNLFLGFFNKMNSQNIMGNSFNKCSPINGEYVHNYSFDCDGYKWDAEASLPTFQNSEAKVVRIGPGANIYQEIDLVAGVDYYIETFVKDTNSSAFVMVITPGGSSSFPIDYVGVGKHSVVYTATETGLHRIGIGTNDPLNSFATFDWLSVRTECISHPEDEYLKNWTFDCGTLYWTFNPSYNAEITPNDDGSIHLKAITNYGSVCPVQVPSESKDWILTVKVTNLVGNGKMSIQKSNNDWLNFYFDRGDGIYSANYNGSIKRIDVGASNDTSAEMDFEFISLKERVPIELPCMTSSDTPYGKVDASSEFSSSYPAWEGVNCIKNAGNCWISTNFSHDDATPQWIRWIEEENQEAIIPERFTLYPRPGMTASWYGDRNPQGLILEVINTEELTHNGSQVSHNGENVYLYSYDEVFNKQDIANWSNGSERSWNIGTSIAGIGIRLTVTKVDMYSNGGNFNTGFSDLRIQGRKTN